MYFLNYRPRRRCLDKCLKGPVWEDLSKCDIVNELKHWFNLNASAFLILSDHCEGCWVANVTLRHRKFFRLFLNTVTACDKYSLLTRDKLMQTIQMHMSWKPKIFALFFSAFFKSALNFEHFHKNITPIAYVFPRVLTTKDMLR